jgi:hypothetical protein
MEGWKEELFTDANITKLKGPAGQIRSAQGWYQWIGLSKDMPRYSF